MDFSRNTQPQPAAPAHQAPAAAPNNSRYGKRDNGKLGRIALVVAVALVAALVGGLALLFSGSKGNAEAAYVDTTKLQAVFLNTGQVYFGKIKSLNDKFFVLTNIYYLQTSQTGAAGANQQANTSISLVKLGCELHEPFDKMVINRSQVTFWENLQDNGQVAKAVATFQKQNPNGQKCADQSTSGSTNANTVQNAGQGAAPANTQAKPTR